MIGKRKEVTFPKEDYIEVVEKYQELKGVKLQGEEFSPIQQGIKTMFMNDCTVEDIVGCMHWLSRKKESWMENWTIGTVKLKMPIYISKRNKYRVQLAHEKVAREQEKKIQDEREEEDRKRYTPEAIKKRREGTAWLRKEIKRKHGWDT